MKSYKILTTLPKVNMLEVLDEETGVIHFAVLENGDLAHRYSAGQYYSGVVS